MSIIDRLEVLLLAFTKEELREVCGFAHSALGLRSETSISCEDLPPDTSRLLNRLRQLVSESHFDEQYLVVSLVWYLMFGFSSLAKTEASAGEVGNAQGARERKSSLNRTALARRISRKLRRLLHVELFSADTDEDPQGT